MTLFYENFEKMRNKRGMKTREVARALNYNEKSLYAWSSKKTAPEDEILLKLADLFDCNVSDFFRVEGERYNRDEVAAYERMLAEESLDEYQEDFIHIYESLSARDRLNLMNLVYEFADEKGIDL